MKLKRSHYRTTLISSASLLLVLALGIPSLGSRLASTTRIPLKVQRPSHEELSRNAVLHSGMSDAVGLGNGTGRPQPRIGTTILGVDVSQYQGNINFSQLSQAVGFAVIRTSYGAPDPGQTAGQYADKKYLQNRTAAEQQGLEIGFYHYAYPQYNSPDAEAKCFTDNIGHLNPGEFVVLDFEEWSYSGDVVSWCKTWLDDVQATLGVRPLIYMSTSRATNGYNWAPVINANYGLWGAQWSYDPNSQPPKTQWSFMAMRQYDDNGSEPGISGAVDQDVFYGSLAQLRAYGYQTQKPTISWVGNLPPQRWYNSNEEYPYHATGYGDLVCHEIIDGNEVAQHHTSDGYVNLVAAPSNGWHEIWAKVTDSQGNVAETSHYFGGLDQSAPNITLTNGTPKQWYNASSAPASIQWLSDEPSNNAGIWHYQYQWDSGGYSGWIDNPNGADSNHHRAGCIGSASLMNGKHTLFVHAQDDVWNDGNHSGNDSTVSLGEFWVDTTAPVMSSFSTSVASPSNAKSIDITCSASDDLSGVDHINVTVDGTEIGKVIGSSGTVTWSTSASSKGFHSLSATPIDAAGNVGRATTSVFYLGTSSPLSGITISPTSVIGGTAAVGTVTLSTAAPSTGLVISLSTSNSNVTSVQASVQIPSGKTSGTFQLSTHGVDSLASTTITASYGGISKKATLGVKPATLLSLTLSPSTLVGGSASNVTASLSGQAGPKGVVISFASSNSSIALLSYKSITIPYGVNTAKNTINTSHVTKAVKVTISGSKGASVVRSVLTVNKG